MYTLPKTWVVRSDKDTHFTGALIQNAMELETLGDPATENKRDQTRSIIQRISIISEQNLDWDIVLFRSTFAPPLTLDCDLDPTIDWVTFEVADGVQVAAAGLYRYSYTSLQILYWNTDAPGAIHVGLVNRNAVAKGAGAAGEIIVELQGITLT